MRRIAYASLGLTVACSLRPWTPSVSVAYWSEDVPRTTQMPVPTTVDLTARWSLPTTSPWAPYNKMTLLAAADQLRGTELPDVAELEVSKRALEVGRRFARSGVPPGTMIISDMRGAASVAFGASLSRAARTPVALVLTFNDWPADEGIVPAEETLAALVQETPQRVAEGASYATPIFLMDAWRLAFRDDEPGPDEFDNRYIVMPNDMPSADVLRAQLVSRVLYVVEDLDETEVEEDDLHPIFAAYQAAGITAYIVDLAWLEKQPADLDWAGALAPRPLFVARRSTLLDDPHFYLRARGGFGGISTLHPGMRFRGGAWGGGSRGGGFGGG